VNLLEENQQWKDRALCSEHNKTELLNIMNSQTRILAEAMKTIAELENKNKELKNALDEANLESVKMYDNLKKEEATNNAFEIVALSYGFVPCKGCEYLPAVHRACCDSPISQTMYVEGEYGCLNGKRKED
jgi:hypothetical protein